MTNKVSIYIVNHNYGQYLKQSIDSVLNQTYKNWDLLIIDNESNDQSHDILRHYADNPKIRIIFQKNIGLNRSNNVAIGKSNGQYIMRLDADDYLHPNAIEIMVKTLEDNKDSGLVFTDYYIVNDAGEELNIYKRHDFSEVELLNQPAHGACTMIRRECLDILDGYDGSYHCQDGWDLWVRFIKNFGVTNVNLPLFYYRQHGNNLTSNEDKLLHTRSQIMEKANNGSAPARAIAIIPVRGNVIDSKSFALQKLGDKCLVDWTIDAALKAKNICHIVVTSPDENVKQHIKNKYKDKVLFIQRSWKLALMDDNLDDTLTNLFNQLPRDRRDFNIITLLSIEAPFRKIYSIDMAINALEVFNSNVVVGVRRANKALYRHDGTGLFLISNSGFSHKEANDIYKTAGGILVIRRGYRYKNIKTEKKIGHIEIDEMGAYYINSKISWHMAQYYAEKIDDIDS